MAVLDSGEFFRKFALSDCESKVSTGSYDEAESEKLTFARIDGPNRMSTKGVRESPSANIPARKEAH
jgi:hypothetical protein